MPALKHTIAAIPGGNTRRTYGTAFWDGSSWFAEVGGNLITCRWREGFTAVQGQKIIVDITTDERGQGAAYVVGGYTDQPRPSTGTILTMTPDVVVSGAFGGSVVAGRVIGSYAIGDNVYLDWGAPNPTVTGPATALVVPRKTNTPKSPGGGDIAGTKRTPATASDTYGAGGWGRAALNERRNVVNNPKLSVNATGWTAGNGTLTRVTTGGPVGFPAFARTTVSGTPTYIDVNGQGSGLNLVTPGKVYYLAGQVRGSVAGTIRLYVQFIDSAGSTLATSSSAAIANTANSWASYALTTSPAPTGAIRVRIIYRLTATMVSGATVDGTATIMADAQGPYFDGDTVPAGTSNTSTSRAWIGAANASQSVETVSATGAAGSEDVSAGGSIAGAWFYGVGNKILTGRTIKEARFRIPARLNLDDPTATVVHLYAHPSGAVPAGALAASAGPFDVTVPGDGSRLWVVLPSTFHAPLIAGGGIYATADSYARFRGRLDDPNSGKLEIDWMS